VAAKKWNDKFVIRGYELAKQGLRKTEIASALGVQPITIDIWMQRKTAFRYAMRKGRKLYKRKITNGDSTFISYINKRLSKELKPLWKKLRALDKAKSGPERIEALLADKGIRTRQTLYIHALICSNFKTTVAMRQCNLSFGMLNDWKENDPYFPQLIDELTFHRGNFYEDALADLVSVHDPQIVRHVNETFNAERGYRKQIQMNVDTTEKHEHVVRVEDLDFTLEEQKELLRKARTKEVESKVIEPEQKALPEVQPVKKKKRKRKRVSNNTNR